MKSIRVDAFADGSVKDALPELGEDGDDQNRISQVGNGDSFRMQDFFKRAANQLQSKQNDDKGNRHAGNVFHAGMTVWVFRVSRFAGNLKSQQSDDRRTGIREVVYSVSGDGNTVKDQTSQDFNDKKKNVG